MTRKYLRKESSVAGGIPTTHLHVHKHLIPVINTTHGYSAQGVSLSSRNRKSNRRPIPTSPHGPPGRSAVPSGGTGLPHHSHVSPPLASPPAPGCPGNQARYQARHQPTASSGRARGPTHPRLLRSVIGRPGRQPGRKRPLLLFLSVTCI